ncbi:MAG: hypothetical protein WCC54_06770, partial [Pseudolabrys sp.]
DEQLSEASEGAEMNLAAEFPLRPNVSAKLSLSAATRWPPLNGESLPRALSSKQLPTNQGDTDNAEKHEPNEIHPEDYGVCVAYDQSIAASTK